MTILGGLGRAMKHACLSADSGRGSLIMPTEQLMVLCPNCDRWFASAIQMDPETWNQIRMQSGLIERCAHCGQATRFAKSEYRFREDDPSDPSKAGRP
jgi:hypothetical protein